MGNLVLSRLVGEAIDIGGGSVTVVGVIGKRVRLALDFPADVPVNRREVTLAIQKGQSDELMEGQTSEETAEVSD